MYITIAEYDTTYERFLGLHHLPDPSQPPSLRMRGNDGKVTANPPTMDFLVMHTYGPWRVDAPGDMTSACEALIALSLYLANE
jgi:hypothetical protein